MTQDGHDSEALFARAAQGDPDARDRLMQMHRQRLRALVAVRIPPAMAARIDPSDVVQEALTVAGARLDEYLQHRPLPFYLWLRGLALERLIELHRRHVVAGKRSVRREVASARPDDGSSDSLAERLVARGVSPSQLVQREELRGQMRQALDQLSDRDREVLILRHLDQLTMREIGAILNLAESAVKVRHLRALRRLKELLRDKFDSEME